MFQKKRKKTGSALVSGWGTRTRMIVVMDGFEKVGDEDIQEVHNVNLGSVATMLSITLRDMNVLLVSGPTDNAAEEASRNKIIQRIAELMGNDNQITTLDMAKLNREGEKSNLWLKEGRVTSLATAHIFSSIAWWINPNGNPRPEDCEECGFSHDGKPCLKEEVLEASKKQVKATMLTNEGGGKGGAKAGSSNNNRGFACKICAPD